MKVTETATSGSEVSAPKTEVLSASEDGKPEIQTASLTATSTTPKPSAVAAPRNAKRRKTLLIPLVAIIGFVVLSYGGWAWWEHTLTWIKTDNAYVAAHVHTISARIAGTVQDVLVEENQAVAAGTVLARLEARDFEIRRQQVEAQGAQAGAQRQQAEAQVAQAQAQAAREQARAAKARLDLDRATALYQGTSGAISKQEFDQAQAESDAAAAALKAAQAAVASAEALVGASVAQEKVAFANLEEVRQQLSYTKIHAPAAGRIGRKNLEKGNRVQPGQALLALVQPEVWVTANFKETQLAHMRPGQRVEIRIDAFPGRVFRGTVESLAPATGAEFALLPPDNATGNFTKIVQRVPVKIVFDRTSATDCAGRIVPGMSVVVEVRIRG